MNYKNRWIQGLYFLATSLTFNTACAIDNPDAPDLIDAFKNQEKTYLQAIENNLMEHVILFVHIMNISYF